MKKFCCFVLNHLLFLPCFYAQPDSGTSAEKLFETARHFFIAGDDKAVIAQLDEAIRLQPDYGDAYVLRGQAYLQLRSCAAAIADFKMALRNNPFHPDKLDSLLKEAQFCDTPTTFEVNWAAPEIDKIQVNTDHYTIQVCIKGMKKPVQLIQNESPVVKQVQRGTYVASICDTSISEQVSLKVGANIFYIQGQGQQSERKTIIYVPSQLDTQMRLAVVIGNSGYQGDDLDLKGAPLSDAAHMRDALEQCGFSVHMYQNLNKADLEKVVTAFLEELNLHSYEAALFYFAGHGLLIDKQGFIAPINANLKMPEDIGQQCISLDSLKTRMVQSRAKLSILLMDACRNNPFRSLKARLRRGMFSANSGEHPSNTNKFFLAYPAGEGQTISNDGWFTQQWIKYMMIHINIHEVMTRTKEAVKEISLNKQIPDSDTDFKKEFFFKK